MYSQDALIQLVRDLALEFGEFTLSSGKTASYYLDCRKLTLDSTGANLVGEGILDLLADDPPDAVGGMAIGADPITAAVITLAGQRRQPMKGFIVRKEAKKHGRGRQLEGPAAAGDKAVIVEDVVTTGGSSLEAIQVAEDFGLKVREVIAIIDRLEGAGDAFARRGIAFRSLLTIRDFGIEPPAG